jgi:hypothetical protein
MAGPISVTEAVGAAFGFLRRSWLRAIWAQLLICLLGATAALAFLGRDFGRAGSLYLAYGLAATMAEGALFRIAFAERRPDDAGYSLGPGGLQWGGVEWRLLAVAVLRWLLFALLWSLLLTLLIAVYIGVASAETGPGFALASPARWRRTLDPAGWLVMSVVALAGLAGLGWIRLRLYLAFPATVAEARVQLLETWRLTKGQVWRMLASLTLVLLPVLGVILALRLGIGLLTLINWKDLGLRHEVLSLIAGVSHAFVILPLSVGLMSYFYGQLGLEAPGVS